VEASTPEFKADIRKLISYLSIQVEKAGVKVIPAEATGQTIKDGGFDVVIVATGAKAWLPDIPGLDQPHVIEALDAFSSARIGKNVVVVGGGLIGRDAALFLALQGKKVTITTRADSLNRDADVGLPFQEIGVLLKMLSENNVAIRTGVQLEKFTDNGVVVRDQQGTRSEIKGDTVVIAAGLVPDKEMAEAIRQIPGLEIISIGDCVEPRRIHNAIHEGFFVSYRL
ncbi:FAD-dependent oxidoreductase, partial [Chloroflexota bacterium]